MIFKKDQMYSNKWYFWIPTYYDKKNDIYFCEPESKEFVSKFYEKEYWNNFSRNRINFFWKIWNLLFDFLNIPDSYNLKNIKILKEKWILNKNIKILEIWCGKWENIKYLRKKWYNIKWIEIDKLNVENINNELKEKCVILWNYEEKDINEKFDLIYLRHVLEHFYDINKVVEKFKNNLNKNWIVFIDVPCCNIKYTLNRSINIHPHIYHFTEKSLEKIFTEKWYKTIHIEIHQIKNINISKNNKINTLSKTIYKILKLNIITNNIRENYKQPTNLIWIFKI